MDEPTLCILGVDHHHTPVAIREKLASGETVEEVRRLLAGLPGAGEAVVLATCNRFEVYVGGSPDHDAVLGLLAERCAVAADELRRHAYWHRGREVVRHLFRVVSSLESLVIGEYQIAHQVKSAYETAKEAGCTGSVLNPLFQRALAVGKAVRSTTAIGRHKLSIASVAVDLARKIHGDLAAARLLVVGAGEMAELSVKHLLASGVRSLSVINRTQERALILAETASARVYPWQELGAAIADHDIVLCSTSANGVVIDLELVRLAIRRRRAPLMFIDVAVPRDVDERVGRLDDVYLYNVDHLESVVASNRELRAEEVDAAAALVDSQANDYLGAQEGGRNALLAQIATFFSDVVAAEEARLAGKITDLDRGDLRYGLERVGNKLQHRLLAWLRAHPGDAEAERLVRELLGL